MSEKKRAAVTAADIVILAVLLLFGFFVYRYAFADASDDTFELEYVVKVSAIRSELSDRVAAGDEVYSADGVLLGRVVSCTPASAVDPDSGRTLPDRWVDLYITVEAQSDGDGRVSGYEIYAERELKLYTTGLYFEGVCISVHG